MFVHPSHPAFNQRDGALDRCVLEIDGDPAGIVVRDGDAYIFFSASRRFRGLNRNRFGTIGKACRRLEAFAAPPARSG